MSETVPTIFHSPRLSAQLAPALSAGDDATAGDRWGTNLLADAIRERATDIHFEPLGELLRVRFRIDGALHDVVTLPEPLGQRLIRYFKASSDLDPGTAVLPANAHVQYEADGIPVDLRVACAPCVTGERMTIRLLHRTRAAMRLTELGLAEEQSEWIRRWLDDMNGMLLVAGPTGSGKTTTLYAMLAEMELMRHSVVTIEDPVEYQIAGVSQIQVDLKRGLTFAEGLRTVLRLDPDYILLGEIRDFESAEVALEAANTGHILLSTLHSRDAAGVVSMLRNLGLGSQDIASSLAFVVAQRLVRKLCLECREETKPSKADLRWLRTIGEPAPEKVWRAPGCEACGKDGYTGRTGIFEVWPIDEESYELILSKPDERTLREHLRERGVKSLLESGLEKAAAGITDLTELRTMGIRSYLEGQRQANAAGKPGREGR